MTLNRKRGQHEGNIYRRADGRWEGRLRVGYRNGKRSRRSVFGRTRVEVAKKLTQLQRDHELGILGNPGRVTIAQFLDQWMAESAQPRLRPKTYGSYQQVIRLHITPYLGHHPIQKLTPQHVQAWTNELSRSGWKRKRTQADDAAQRPEQRGVSPRTIHYARAILRAALQQALRWGIVQRNVATLITPPRMVKREIRPLEPQQARDLIAAAQSHRLGVLVTTACALGLRQGEALGLKWADVDLNGGLLHVRHALQRIGGTWTLVEPKSARSRRAIALPRIVTAALKAHRTTQLEERLAAGQDWENYDFVFCTKTGLPLDPSNAKRVFRMLLKAANVPIIRFHDLRHTAATLLIAQGVNPRDVAEILGHSSVSLTMNTYAHALDSRKHDAARRMDDILEGHA